MSHTARARNTDPVTSHQAAAKVDVPTHREQVYRILLDAGRDLTDGEIAAEQRVRVMTMGWSRASLESLRSRRRELWNDGEVLSVVDPDARTPFGNHTLRWRAVPRP